jgi:hypothetical protein
MAVAVIAVMTGIAGIAGIGSEWATKSANNVSWFRYDREIARGCEIRALSSVAVALSSKEIPRRHPKKRADRKNPAYWPGF